MITTLPPIFGCTVILILWVLQISIVFIGIQTIRDWDPIDLLDYGMIISLIALILLCVMVFICVTYKIAEGIF